MSTTQAVLSGYIAALAICLLGLWLTLTIVSRVERGRRPSPRPSSLPARRNTPASGMPPPGGRANAGAAGTAPAASAEAERGNGLLPENNEAGGSIPEVTPASVEEKG